MDLDLKFNVNVDGIDYNLSLKEIHTLRDTDNVIITFEEQESDLSEFTYENFSKLARFRQIFLDLDLVEQESSTQTTNKVKINSNSQRYSNDHFDTMDPINFLKFACQLIHKFSGDPEQLDSFIENVLLVKSMATPAVLPQYFKFVKGRLDGTARTAAIDCDTIDAILAALKEKITRDSSENLESQLSALRFDYKNLSEFTSEVEKVANKLIDSLIIEGVSKGKANAMAVSSVVKTCRKSAKNSMIENILASATFNSPKEVLSKFRLEVAEINKEKHVLNMQATPPYYTPRHSFNNVRPHNFGNRPPAQPRYSHYDNRLRNPQNFSNNNGRQNWTIPNGIRNQGFPNQGRPIRVMHEGEVTEIEQGNEQAARWPQAEEN